MSRPEQLRRAFRKHSGRILTREQVIRYAMGPETLDGWWHNLKKSYSMALSRMVQSGEVDSYKLLGKHGYCLVDDYTPKVEHA